MSSYGPRKENNYRYHRFLCLLPHSPVRCILSAPARTPQPSPLPPPFLYSPRLLLFIPWRGLSLLSENSNQRRHFRRLRGQITVSKSRELGAACNLVTVSLGGCATRKPHLAHSRTSRTFPSLPFRFSFPPPSFSLSFPPFFSLLFARYFSLREWLYYAAN